jgi:hypothetical protein
MRPAYVRVELGDPDEAQAPSFTISPVPFLTLYGEDLRPTKAERKTAESYQELRRILMNDFQIALSLLPSAKYFEPNPAERAEDARDIYRTVPEDFGEPQWRTEARNAVVYALEEADYANGQVQVNDRHSYSLQELQQELEAIAEAAGGKTQIKGEPYQPDYDVLVKEVLSSYSGLLAYVGLPRIRKIR